MKLPPQLVPHLDHRITVLLSFTIRREQGFFGHDHGEEKNLGDLYRSSLEASGIMLRLLLEFLGVRCAYDYKTKKRLGLTPNTGLDSRLGSGSLAGIAPLDIAQITACDASRLAALHDEVSKRTGHPAFEKVVTGMKPDELEWASEWILRELWSRCYAPDPIVVHRDLASLLHASHWKGVRFQAAP